MDTKLESWLGKWVHETYRKRVALADLHDAVESYCRERERLKRFDIHDSNEPYRRNELNDDQVAIFSLSTTGGDDAWVLDDEGFEFSIDWNGVEILFHGYLAYADEKSQFKCIFHYDVSALANYRFAVEKFEGNEADLENFLTLQNCGHP